VILFFFGSFFSLTTVLLVHLRNDGVADGLQVLELLIEVILVSILVA
jgi:hypothetical protein